MSILGVWLRTEADKLTAEKINKFVGLPLASNDDSKIFAYYFEVNGFKFIKIKIIGPLKVETFEGCKVIFEGINESIEIESDSTEINTDYSFSLKKGITEFDADLEENLIEMIIHERLKSISIAFNRTIIKFSIEDISILKSLVTSE